MPFMTEKKSVEQNGITLQASIRHAAERSKSITYLFSGSKHRPLKKLFFGKDNPLYHLCDQLTLERISEIGYQEFLNHAAKEKWGEELPSEVQIVTQNILTLFVVLYG